MDWFNKLFVQEAKKALNSHASVGSGGKCNIVFVTDTSNEATDEWKMSKSASEIIQLMRDGNVVMWWDPVTGISNMCKSCLTDGGKVFPTFEYISVSGGNLYSYTYVVDEDCNITISQEYDFYLGDHAQG